MLVDRDGQGCDSAFRCIGDIWRVTAVNDTAWKMPEQVDDTGSGEALDQFSNLRAHPGKIGYRRKNRKKYVRAHIFQQFPAKPG